MIGWWGVNEVLGMIPKSRLSDRKDMTVLNWYKINCERSGSVGQDQEVNFGLFMFVMLIRYPSGVLIKQLGKIIQEDIWSDF